MDEKVYNQLQEARVHFYAWRLQPAYQILRRYFDRLPFRPEPEHAEFIGIFARVLLELGKDFELKFYMKELERVYELDKSAYIGYALGVVYCFLPEPRLESARQVFEQVLRAAPTEALKAKAKIMLAYYYDVAKNDVGACRMLIDSIAEPTDVDLNAIWRTWKAKLLMEEGHLESAKAAYHEILSTFDPSTNWYSWSIAMLNLGVLYLRQEKLSLAEQTLANLKQVLGNRQFKSLSIQIEELGQMLEQKSNGHGVIYCSLEKDFRILSYQQKTLSLKRRSPVERLLDLLSARKTIEKSVIVNALYDREYLGEADDKLIYYHIHCLRKRLRELGAEEAIEMSAGGYRLLPRIENRRVEE